MPALRLIVPVALLSALSLASCGNTAKNGGATKPIVLGDSTTIVTETNPALLEDIVPPMNLPENGENTPASAPPADDTAAAGLAAAAPETEAPAAPPVQQPAAGAGYTVDFGEVKVTLVGGNIRDRGRSFSGSSSASVVADKGSYAGTGLQVAGGTVSRIQQRAQLAVLASRGSEVLLLSDLGTGSGSWQPLRQQGSTWVMAAPGEGSFRSISAGSIASAVQRAAQRKRLSRAAQRDWAAAVKNVTSVNQAPLQTVLRSVTWRIDGKDSRGKSFSKEVRVDVPM